MPIVSAVLHVRDVASLERELGALVEFGPAHGNRVPVVVDTPDRAADKALWRRIERHPDVLHVQLTFAHFEDVHEVSGDH